MDYKTIKDCAVDYICIYGDKLTNKQIAEKVKNKMESETTSGCIAWYKNKINRGIIVVDKRNCTWLNKNSSNSNKEYFFDNNIEKEIIENEAERFVYNLEYNLNSA